MALGVAGNKESLVFCFVSGWGAEGVAVRNLSSTSFLPGSGVEPNLRRVDPWALGAGWQSNQLLGGGTPGLMEPSRGRMRPEDRSPGTQVRDGPWAPAKRQPW